MYTNYYDNYQTNRAVLCETDKKAFSYSRLTWVPKPDEDDDDLGGKLIRMMMMLMRCWSGPNRRVFPWTKIFINKILSEELGTPDIIGPKKKKAKMPVHNDDQTASDDDYANGDTNVDDVDTFCWHFQLCNIIAQPYFNDQQPFLMISFPYCDDDDADDSNLPLCTATGLPGSWAAHLMIMMIMIMMAIKMAMMMMMLMMHPLESCIVIKEQRVWIRGHLAIIIIIKLVWRLYQVMMIIWWWLLMTTILCWWCKDLNLLIWLLPIT